MKILLLFLIPLILLGCASSDTRSVLSVSQLNVLAKKEYDGKIVACGYYYYHCEEDVLFEKPLLPGEEPLFKEPKFQLTFCPLFERIQPYDGYKYRIEVLKKNFDGQKVLVRGVFQKRIAIPYLVNSPIHTYLDVESIQRFDPPLLPKPSSYPPIASERTMK
ncbi:MAG TPA: hypothetical protein DET40_13885 [Lentisphaeria bacterium]|nr:MAG: hypothetical protein A2X45_04955 [Lentisphaerae bacterium GWF2_50_93]HCE44631.1 hypothetical protein [Lentisphaeria bacterium]